MSHEIGFKIFLFRGLTGVRHSEPGSRVHDVTARIGASFVPVVMRFTRQQVGQREDVAHKPDQQDGHDDLKEKTVSCFCQVGAARWVPAD